MISDGIKHLHLVDYPMSDVWSEMMPPVRTWMNWAFWRFHWLLTREIEKQRLGCKKFQWKRECERKKLAINNCRPKREMKRRNGEIYVYIALQNYGNQAKGNGKKRECIGQKERWGSTWNLFWNKRFTDHELSHIC